MTTGIPLPVGTPLALQENGEVVMNPIWLTWFENLSNLLATRGASGTLTLPPATVGGTTGTVEIVNGLITSITAPT